MVGVAGSSFAASPAVGKASADREYSGKGSEIHFSGAVPAALLVKPLGEGSTGHLPQMGPTYEYRPCGTHFRTVHHGTTGRW